MSGPKDGGAQPAQTAAIAERNTAMWKMRVNAHTQREIADHFGISQARVSQIFDEMLKERQQQGSDALRAFELDKLDQAEQAVLEVLRRHHVTVSNGKVMYLEDAPMLDDAPVLAATDRLLRIAQRRAALLGLDAPQKIETTSYDYTVNGVDAGKLT